LATSSFIFWNGRWDFYGFARLVLGGGISLYQDFSRSRNGWKKLKDLYPTRPVNVIRNGEIPEVKKRGASTRDSTDE